MVNIAILVSGNGTNLQTIIDSITDGRIENARICCVISSRKNAFALTRAEKANIPTECLLPKDYANTDCYGAALREKLALYNTDLVVLAGFLTILDNKTVKTFYGRMLNLHPSLLPAFGGIGCYGIKVHEMVLARGVKLTGATVHFVNEKADEGPIILQKAIAVLDGDTPESLQARVMSQCEQDILPRAIDLFCKGKLLLQENKVRIACDKPQK